MIETAFYVVATPIGHLADLTPRARETLATVSIVFCEDTRHTRRLLDHYGIGTRCAALHMHNERAATSKVLEYLAAGQAVAYVSDAGTPGIADPGARAVAAVREAGFPVIPLPGPCAAIAAFSAAGLPDERFLFVGFLPSKDQARRAELEKLKEIPAALVFYEAPHRIADTLVDLARLMEPERTLIVARELSKLFEQIAALPVAEGPAWLAADDNRRRGEFVLIVSQPPPRQGLSAADERLLRLLLAELPLKQAARLAAEIAGGRRNEFYARALALQAEATPSGWG